MSMPNKGLTVRQIFDLLRYGKKVTLGFENSPAGTAELDKLISYLNVIKSREKASMEEFGFDFQNCIFKYTVHDTDDKEHVMVVLFIEQPTPKKRYAAFKIEDNNDTSKTDS